LEQKVTLIINHMANSHRYLADILDIERHVVLHSSHLIKGTQDPDPSFEALEGMTEQSLQLMKSITSYLTHLAELEEVIAVNLGYMMKELHEQNEE
jgi:hypothetical protein